MEDHKKPKKSETTVKDMLWLSVGCAGFGTLWVILTKPLFDGFGGGVVAVLRAVVYFSFIRSRKKT